MTTSTTAAAAGVCDGVTITTIKTNYYYYYYFFYFSLSSSFVHTIHYKSYQSVNRAIVHHCLYYKQHTQVTPFTHTRHLATETLKHARSSFSFSPSGTPAATCTSRAALKTTFQATPPSPRRS